MDHRTAIAVICMYEARIKKLKKMIRTQNMLLQQCFNRINERIKFESAEPNPHQQPEIELSRPLNHEKYIAAKFPKFTIVANKKVTILLW